jgi:hypothetical protein
MIHRPARRSKAAAGDGPPAPSPLAEAFTLERWRREDRGQQAVEIRVSADDDEQLPSDVEDVAVGVLEPICLSLGLPQLPVRVVSSADLSAGEYEVVLGGAVRVAGSLETPWRTWWGDHPTAGPAGRSGAATAPDDVDGSPQPGVRVGRALEEALWDDPSLLLANERAAEVIRTVAAQVTVLDPEKNWLPVLCDLVSRRVPLSPLDELPDAVRRVEASDRVGRAQQAACVLRPYEVTVGLGPELYAVANPNQRESYLTQQLGVMHEGLAVEFGVGFPEISFSVRKDLGARGYEVTINGLQRVRGEIPNGRVLVNVPPAEADAVVAEGGAEHEPIVGSMHPLNGMPVTWADEDLVDGGQGVVTWSPVEFLVLQLASVLAEAAHEFADLAWTEQLLQRLVDYYGMDDVIAEVDRQHSRELVAAVLQSLTAEAVSIRDLERVLQRLLNAGPTRLDTTAAIPAADGSAARAVEVAEHVRAGLAYPLSHAAAQAWQFSPGTGLRGVERTVVAITLTEAQETALEAVVVNGTRTAVYGFDAAGELLRELRLARERSGVPLPVLVVKRAVRPHLRRLIAAQFPRMRVLARDELSPDVTLHVLGEVGFANTAIA